MTAQPAPVVSDREKRITLAALMVVFLLGALDTTIVTTAMPSIIDDLKGLELYAWVTTAYMLSSTVMVPIYGRLGDLYGRKPILIIGISVFLAGSALCGLAGEFGPLPLLGGGMVQLIFFRAVQGLGGGALFSSAFAIIADLFTPRERSKFAGLFGAVFGLSAVIGPLAGGLFSDMGMTHVLGAEVAGWRWVFYVNLPLGLLALVLIAARMPTLPGTAKGSIDLVGSVLFVGALVPLLLALTWGGLTYPWGSARILGLLAMAAVCLVGFIGVERVVRHPLLPLTLFENKVFATANAAGFLIGMAFLGTILFIPLFMQVVMGVTATSSAVTLMPLMVGMIIGSAGSGFVVNRTGRYKPMMMAGCVTLAIGILLLATLDVNTDKFGISWRMVVVGLGLGPGQSLYNIAVQNAVSAHQIGIATSASQFFRQIGSVAGVAVFGTLLVSNLSHELPRQLPDVPGMSSTKLDLGEAQAQAMHAESLHDRILHRAEDLYARLVRAYHGDEGAREALLADDSLPDELKDDLRMSSVTGGTPPAVLYKLGAIHDKMLKQAEEVVPKVERGTKLAFSSSITGTFKTSLWIIALGVLATLLIPTVPLRTKSAAEERAEEAAAAAAE
jgi:EmrB/QacA subfamily drug resistance transporter